MLNAPSSSATDGVRRTWRMMRRAASWISVRETMLSSVLCRAKYGQNNIQESAGAARKCRNGDESQVAFRVGKSNGERIPQYRKCLYLQGFIMNLFDKIRFPAENRRSAGQSTRVILSGSTRPLFTSHGQLQAVRGSRCSTAPGAIPFVWRWSQ